MPARTIGSLFLGIFGVVAISFLMARITKRLRIEWSDNISTLGVGLIYGLLMISGAVSFYSITEGLRGPRLVLEILGLLAFILGVDYVFGIGFFRKNSPNHVVFVSVITIIIGALSFSLGSWLF